MEPIFSVSELNEAIRHHLSRLGLIKVQGEITTLNVSQRKWLFITLSDSQASVDIFAPVFQIPNLKFLKPGLSVLVVGSPGLYQRSGRFRISATEVIVQGAGNKALELAQLTQKLTSEGLLDPARKRPLPQFPQRIGLITAANSQAYQDVVKIISARFPPADITHFPATVQGTQAVDSLCLAIHQAQSQPLDALIITRGGGATEDLDIFNHETLVRTIFASTIPTIVAIGHEGDTTLAELVADARASTPSDAAATAVPESKDLIRSIDRTITSLFQLLQHQHLTRSQHLTSLIDRLSVSSSLPATKLNLLSQRLWSTRHQLVHSLTTTQTLAGQLNSRLSQAYQSHLTHLQQLLTSQSTRLIALNPNRPLDLGFSLTYQHDRLLTSVAHLDPTAPLLTKLSDGTITSIISNHVKKT